MIENTVGKGGIARYEQFLLFPQCFQKTCFPGASKGVIVWEWVNASLKVHFGEREERRGDERRGEEREREREFICERWPLAYNTK